MQPNDETQPFNMISKLLDDTVETITGHISQKNWETLRTYAKQDSLSTDQMVRDMQAARQLRAAYNGLGQVICGPGLSGKSLQSWVEWHERLGELLFCRPGPPEQPEEPLPPNLVHDEPYLASPAATLDISSLASVINHIFPKG